MVGINSLQLILQVLARYRSREITDPRDKVYALMGLAKDVRDVGVEGLTYSIQADYGKSVAEVYRDTTLFALLSTSSIEILSHCREGQETFASWVPD